MSIKYYNSSYKYLNFFIVFLLIVFFFYYHFGLQMLDPGNVGWLMIHDWATHYLGWFFYRNEPWSFPIGVMHHYNYPVGTTVGFTDSIPILAVFFKLFSFILPENFQYFGWWLFSCYILLAWYSIVLLDRLKIRRELQLICLIFIVFNPVIVYRAMHPALCTHWLIIASLCMYLKNTEQKNYSKTLIKQHFLFLLSAMITPYMTVMIFVFWIALIIRLFWIDKKLSFIGLVAHTLLPMLSLLIMWYVLGFFIFQNSTNLGIGGGYGLYSLNLNSFFNSQGYSTFSITLKTVSPQQYEGFMYLGLGGIIIVLWAIAIFVYRILSTKNKTQFIRKKTYLLPLLVLCIALCLFGMSPVISFNEHILFRVPLPEFILKIGEMFRASARFVWVGYYLLWIFAFYIIISSSVPKKLQQVILGILLVIQVYDLHNIYQPLHLKYQQPYQMPLEMSQWKKLFNQSEKIIFYPPFKATYQNHHDYRYFSFMAAEAQKPIDMGYVARNDEKVKSSFEDKLSRLLLGQEEIDPDNIYVTTSEYLIDFLMIARLEELSYVMLDGYHIFFKTTSTLHQTADLSKLKIQKPQEIDSLLNQKIGLYHYLQKEELPVANNQIKYGIDRFEEYDDYLDIQGWAFNTDENTQNHELFLIFKSDDHILRIRPKAIQRQDVSFHYQNENLLEVGFSIKLAKKLIKKDNYQIGIMIIDQDSGKKTLRFTDKNLNIKYQYNQLEKIATIPPENDIIKVGIDRFTHQKNQLNIFGWAFSQKINTKHHQISIILKSNQNIYQTTPKSVKRPDVSKYFNNNTLDDAGFDLQLSNHQLKQGKYQIGIVIKDLKTNDESLHWLEQTLNIVSSQTKK